MNLLKWDANLAMQAVDMNRFCNSFVSDIPGLGSVRVSVMQLSPQGFRNSLEPILSMNRYDYDEPNDHDPSKDDPNDHDPPKDDPNDHDSPKDDPNEHDPPKDDPNDHDSPKDDPNDHEPLKRMTRFVVMTTDAGFCLAPVTFDHSTFFFVTIGTALCSCAANTLNQIAEVPYDAQMDRTKGRPLVKAVISPMHAFLFSVFSGTTGALCLYYGTNTVTTILGVSNILLYAGIYTSLKRKHWSNTWVGAVVGAIPPVMGWTAATGSLDAGALIFSGILYAWQFPHFYALAWRRRGDYARGSYHMLPLSHPVATKYVVANEQQFSTSPVQV
uniref:protoheme IX farnesyltransferase, mitochondrial n=1 Tax=Ciona intestinalis TaxID=7719 RepID=UPI000EF4CB62|nr:protoheme IX farnesyltransferase, mitochondrial [Ciona intestinalis]|eukprot:XP_026695727.1 protoheme IX farnesyltransferase, mitochondrial [Ciona intestinalis]